MNGGHHQNLVRLASGQLGVGDLTTDAWGVQKVSLPTSLFHGLFTYDVPSRQWLIWEDGTEVVNSESIAATSQESALKVTASAAIPHVIVGSKRHPRYQPNRGHLYSSSMILPSPTAAGVRDFGLLTEENGVFFRLKSDGKLYAVLRSGSVETREEEIDTSGLTGFDVSKGNIYDIQFQWRGVGSYYFYIGDPATSTSKLVHTFHVLGTLTGLSIENPALPARFEVTRTGSTDVTMYCGCVDVSSENGLPAEKAFYTSTTSNDVTCTTNTPIIAIRQPTTINGSHNTRDMRLLRMTLDSDKKGSISFWLTRDDTAITGGSWVTVNGGIGSYIEENKTATSVNIAKMHLVREFTIQANISKDVNNPDPKIVDFILVHGDHIVITGTGTTALMSASIEWGEEV